MKKWSKTALLAVSFGLVAQIALAGGNVRPGGSLSPGALGMGGAHNAVAGDGSAFYHNVANISHVPDFLEFDLDTIVTKAKFREFGSSKDEESAVGLFPMPLFARTHCLNDKLTLGLSLYPNDGLGVEYQGLKYHKSLLASINITEALAWQITDELALGAGLDVVYGQRVWFDFSGEFVKPKDLIIRQMIAIYK